MYNEKPNLLQIPLLQSASIRKQMIQKESNALLGPYYTLRINSL